MTTQTPGLTVPTIEQQTGWNKRPLPVSICQDLDVLRGVRQWDFDLTDQGFLDYAHARGVLYKAGVSGSKRFRFTADHTAAEADFKSDPYFQRAIPSRQYPDGYPYSDADMETHWQIMLAVKGALQDCWQIFHQTVRFGTPSRNSRLNGA